MIYHQIFSTYEANNSLKLSFTLNCVLESANDFKTINKLTRFAFDLVQKFEVVTHEWKSFPNPSDTQQRYNKYLTNLIFSVRTVSYGSSVFFPMIYGPCALHLSHKSKGKKLGPQLTVWTSNSVTNFDVFKSLYLSKNQPD